MFMGMRKGRSKSIIMILEPKKLKENKNTEIFVDVDNTEIGTKDNYPLLISTSLK